ncbi:hypothetical protein ACIBJE_14080 [Micromonospora sp. NPDC050187]|uniref:hypothetical protein n=1 Tax=Micromonospora sp. NPDC050187 TaxID=3364277 RepID=UPI0037AC83BC
MTVYREVPFLVQAAWYCLDHHRHSRCPRCTETGFCPMVDAARARIRTWRRHRGVFGWR